MLSKLNSTVLALKRGSVWSDPDRYYQGLDSEVIVRFLKVGYIHITFKNTDLLWKYLQNSALQKLFPFLYLQKTVYHLSQDESNNFLKYRIRSYFR